MTVEALTRRRRVHRLRPRTLRVLMTFDAQSTGLSDEERRVLRRVSAMAGRTFAGDRVNARQVEGVCHVTVTSGAKIAFGGDEKRRVVGRVRSVAIETGSFCRWVV